MKNKLAAMLIVALIATLASVNAHADEDAVQDQVNGSSEQMKEIGYFSNKPEDFGVMKVDNLGLVFYGKLADGKYWDDLPVKYVNQVVKVCGKTDCVDYTYKNPKIAVVLYMQDPPFTPPAAPSSGGECWVEQDDKGVAIAGLWSGNFGLGYSYNCTSETTASNVPKPYTVPVYVPFSACHPLLDKQRFTCTIESKFIPDIEQLRDPNYYNARISFISGSDWVDGLHYGDTEKLNAYPQSVIMPLADLLGSTKDTDSDTIPDKWDNCAEIANKKSMTSKYDSNSYQQDSDFDGVGDACDKCNDYYDPTNVCQPPPKMPESEPEATKKLYFSQKEKDYGIVISGDKVVFFAMFGASKKLSDFPEVAGKRLGVFSAWNDKDGHYREHCSFPAGGWTNENGDLDWYDNPIKLACLGIKKDKGVMCTASLDQVAQSVEMSADEFKAAFDANNDNVRFFFGGGLDYGRPAYKSPFVTLKSLRETAGKSKDKDDDGIPDKWDDSIDKIVKTSAQDDANTSQGASADNSDDEAEVNIADEDGDGISDDLDACQQEVGSPSLDPARNGCPGARLNASSNSELNAEGCSLAPMAPVDPAALLLIAAALVPIIARRKP